MKIPIHCPKCNDILLNEEVFSLIGAGVWRKSCSKRLDHKFAVFYKLNSSEADSLCIEVIDSVEAHWDFRNKLLSISKKSKSLKDRLKSTSLIPFFEPDLSDYKKLIKKMKTYILFG